MKRCPQCNKSFPDAESFCDDDGSGLVSAAGPVTTRVDDLPGAAPEPRIECPVCGGKAEPGEIICNFCGARLDISAAPPPAPGPATPSRPARAPTPRPTGTARVEHTFPDERPTGEDHGAPGARRWLGIIGYTLAALMALIGGAWLALHLTKSANPPVVQASPAEATGTPIPAAVATAPTVALASTIPTQVSGPAAAAPERSREALKKLFDSNRAALLDIYARALDTDSAAHDGLMVRVSIDPDGKVYASSIRISTAPNPSLDAEVLNSIAGWNFGASSAGAADADLPIIFAHGGAEGVATEAALSAKLAVLSPSEPPEYALASASPSAVATPPPVVALPPPPEAAAPSPPRHRHPRVAARPPKPTLLEKVLDRLRVDPRTRRVKAYTNSGGVVTLYGRVFDDQARRVAVNSVRGVSGVNDVIDNLKTETGEWQQQQDTIMRQLQGAGLTKVTVKVIGKDAFLDGEVSSDLDRERAVTITEGAAPVKVRTNLIRVTPGNVFGF